MRSSKIPLPFVILAAALGVIFLLVLARRTPEAQVRPDAAPLVRIWTAEPTTYRFDVRSQGEVSPRRESDLIPQVSGEVQWVSPALAAGGFFEVGDVLARIDNADYRVSRESARAAVARGQSEYGRAKKERERQQRLAVRSVASQARIDDAENAYQIADALLREARASLERADRDLARTEMKAPYRGRVREEQVDVGQFVARGNSIGKIYAVDFAEVRLPLPDREFAYLDLPLVPELQSPSPATAASTGETEGPNTESVNIDVRLTAEFAGAPHEWLGTLVRTEAELDPRSRMIHVVARVADPYGIETPRSAPLPVGLFVGAVIAGKEVENAFVLPRDALRDDGQIYIVNAESHLEFRTVEVLRTERDQVVVTGGIATGDRICTSPLQAAIDGMRVRVANDPAPAGSAEAPSATPDPDSADAADVAHAAAPSDVAADLKRNVSQDSAR